MAKRRLPSNWRSRIEIILEFKDCSGSTAWVMQFRKGRTPKGFVRKIGYLEVSSTKPHVVEDVCLETHFLRRGLGTTLYLHALEKFGSLTTLYPSASEDAQSLWKSLVRTHPSKQDFFAGLLTIFKS